MSSPLHVRKTIDSTLIVGICGSPRKQATDHVLHKALDELKAMGFHTEFFTVRGKNIAFCRHCDYCLKNN
ncbi:MAG: flavodoxin family protein, partial [Candidatus Bathyarchaeota archaeon]